MLATALRASRAGHQGGSAAQTPAARRTLTEHVAVRQTGRNSFAAIGASGLYNSAVMPFAGNSEAPAVTGGGSAGYNEMLKNY